MLISLNWIKDFTKLPNISADDLANDFTMTTAEVEEVQVLFGFLKEIKVAQIVSIRKHPEADKLNLVTVDYGETLEVVCGASNVREGLKVPYAPVGVTLPNGLTLTPKKIRGVLSSGMLCSAEELGQVSKIDGLLELKSDAPIGQSMLDYFSIKEDVVLDVDNKSLTHRPDLWGHYGLAREFAAKYQVKLNEPFNDEWISKIESKFTKDESPIKPKIESGSCSSYYGITIKGVKVQDSPDFIQQRLSAVGVRSINNIVDISNYVMLELGIPLHIFDRQKIQGDKIIIRSAKENQSFKTLDEVERTLQATDTIICDSERPLVLGGVMGGADSTVELSTTEIFIEVANFDSDAVRRTSTRLGLRTDSSARYEKSLDSQQLHKTMLRTIELILETCPKAEIIGKLEYDGEDLSKYEKLTIETTQDRINSVLGYEVSKERLNTIFNSLGFEVEGEFKLQIPSFRTTKDIQSEADIIEEVGRMIGYDNIQPISPRWEIAPTKVNFAKSLHRSIQDFFVIGERSYEVMTYPLVGESILKKANWKDVNAELSLVNALSVDADRMRPSLVPQALEVAAQNQKHFDTFSFFELGRVYSQGKASFASENNQLLLASYSKKDNQFLSCLNMAEKLLSKLGVPFDFQGSSAKFDNHLVSQDWSGRHPHEFLNLKVLGKFQGAVFSVHPLLLRNFKIKGNLSFFLWDMESFIQSKVSKKRSYRPISKFPGASFDCTVVTSKDTLASEILNSLKKVKVKEIASKRIVDVYHMNSEEKAVTLRVSFESDEKTLPPELIKTAENSIMDCLEKSGFPLKK